MESKIKVPPCYFKKYIFRIWIALCFVLVFFALEGNNYNFTSAYATCPIESTHDCLNPFHVCDLKENEINDFCLYKRPAEKYCINNLCDKKYILPGETVGFKPTPIFIYYNEICFLLLLLAFGLNHFLWRRRI